MRQKIMNSVRRGIVLMETTNGGANLSRRAAILMQSNRRAVSNGIRPKRRILSAFLILLLLLAARSRVYAYSTGQAASLVIGQSSFTTSTAATTATGLNTPLLTAFDSSGNLWVVDGANRVLKYTRPFYAGEAASVVIGQSSFTTSVAATTATGLYTNDGIAFDSSGNLWVADAQNNRVLEYTYPFSTGQAASLVIGQSSFTTNTQPSPPTATGLGSPTWITFDSSGNLWVADAENNRILEYTRPFSTGQAASLVIGQPSFTTSAAATTATGLSEATGIVFDSSRNLWVADRGNNRVLEFTYPFSTGEAASLVIGQSSFTTSAAATTASGFNSPRGIALDSSGNLWVADRSNNRVLEFTYPFSTGEAASVVIGQSSFTTSAAATTATGVSEPRGIAFDSSGNLWVAEQGNNRVLEYGVQPPPPPSIFQGGIAPAYSTVATIQPGEWVSIYGTNLASSTATWDGGFPTFLGDTFVAIDGKPAYLSCVSPTQIDLQAPDDTATGPVPVVVTTATGSFTSTVTLAQFAPSFFLLDSKHVAGIILRSNGSGAYGGGSYDILGPTGNSLGYPTVAAKAGDVVELFSVGLGPTNPTVPAGQAFSGAAQTTNLVNLLINKVNVIPSFAGLSGAGLYQINLTVPAGLGTGDVTLVATVGGAETPPNVVISLQ
jgi:uncharacterized protein (TIGR03437 family)